MDLTHTTSSATGVPADLHASVIEPVACRQGGEKNPAEAGS
jgi:hypothetical protein